jgi:hypothetical protein
VTTVEILLGDIYGRFFEGGETLKKKLQPVSTSP